VRERERNSRKPSGIAARKNMMNYQSSSLSWNQKTDNSMEMVDIIVNNKANRLVSKRGKRKSAFDVTIALLIVCLIDRLSWFLSALFSVSQSINSSSFFSTPIQKEKKRCDTSQACICLLFIEFFFLHSHHQSLWPQIIIKFWRETERKDVISDRRTKCIDR